MRLLALATAFLFSSMAHAAGESECASLKSYATSYAFCLAHHENYSKCSALDSPLEEQCLARAKKSATPCNSLGDDDKNNCIGIGLSNYSKCGGDDAAKKAWCVALAKLNDTTCTAAGDLKVDCNRTVGLLASLVAVVTPDTSTTTTTTTTGSDDPVATQLKTDLGEDPLKALLTKLTQEQIVALRDALGKDRLKRYEGSLKADGLKKILDAGVTAVKLKEISDKLGDDKLEAFGALALAAVGPEITPTQLGELLTAPPTAYVKDFAEMSNAGKLIKDMVAHYGDATKTGAIFTSASTANVPKEDLKKFFVACKKYGWKKTAEIDIYFQRGVTSGATWDQMLDWAATLTTTTTGNVTMVGGRNTADGAAPHKVTLKDALGNDVVVTFNAADAAHVASRHTWDRFAVVMGNCKPMNSMFPVSITESKIMTMGSNILASSEVATLVASMQPTDSTLGTITVDGVNVEFRVTLNGVNAMVSFYPTGGTDVQNVPKDGMRGAISLHKSK
jgi:hypothetical protein